MKEIKHITHYIKDKELDLERIVDDFTAYVKTIINNMAGNNLSYEDKEEIFSDTFFILWKSNYDKILILDLYIAGIVRNLVKEKFKKKKITYDISEFENILPINNNDIEMFSEERENIEQINNILKGFKKSDVQIIHMFYYSSIPTKDIAKKLNMSDLNVRSRLSRIRKKIRKELDKGGKNGR